MSLSERIEMLRALAITAKTCIYNEDAMTAIELAGQTACKVNECVEAINAIIDAIEDITMELGFVYDETTESLTLGGKN